MEDNQSVKALQWLSYIGRTPKNIHTENGREIYLAGVSNVKVNDTAQRRMMFLSTFGVLAWVSACPIDTNTCITLRKLCRKDIRKL
jgi:hypothetical protein